MNIAEAIKIAHEGRTKRLDVKSTGYGFVWTPEADQGWIDYQKAMDVLGKHPKLQRILEKMKII